ncbi:MAG: PaaI family thioesterase [Chloroflexota bacterium]
MEFPTNKELWLQDFDRIHLNTAVENLEIKLVDIDEDHIELRMPISEKTRQPYGLLHGGVSMLLAETAASVHATWGVDLSRVQPVGIEISGSHVRSASEGEVRAVGSVVRRSKSLIVHQVEIIDHRSKKLLSSVRVTNFYKPVKGQ